MPAGPGQPTAVETPVASRAATANENVAFDGDWDGVDGLVAYVVISAVSGTSPTATFALQDSPDGTNWATVATGAAQTAAGTHAIRVGSDTPFTGRLRLNVTVGGTTPSFTYSVVVYSENSEN